MYAPPPLHLLEPAKTFQPHPPPEKGSNWQKAIFADRGGKKGEGEGGHNELFKNFDAFFFQVMKKSSMWGG